MNASLVSRAAQAILQAQASGRVTPAGIAAALESAGYLQVPGEVRELRLQAAGLVEDLAKARRATAGAGRERDLMRERVAEPYGCAHCGTEQSGHGRRYLSDVGVHQWVAPSDAQVKGRMLARRAARPSVAALVARVAELEAAAEVGPLDFALNLDAKSTDNFLGDIARATDYEPQCGAVDEVAQTIAQWRELVAKRASEEDPHDSELHHTYRVSRDLPEVPHA